MVLMVFYDQPSSDARSVWDSTSRGLLAKPRAIARADAAVTLLDIVVDRADDAPKVWWMPPPAGAMAPSCR